MRAINQTPLHQLTVRMECELFNQLRLIAFREHRSVSSQIRVILRHSIKQYDIQSNKTK